MIQVGSKVFTRSFSVTNEEDFIKPAQDELDLYMREMSVMCEVREVPDVRCWLDRVNAVDDVSRNIKTNTKHIHKKTILRLRFNDLTTTIMSGKCVQSQGFLWCGFMYIIRLESRL